MPHLIKMPKLSDDMKEGTIVKWFKKPGDRIEEGEVLFEVETDKANLEVECYYPGILLSIEVPEGKSVPIGTVIAKVAESEEEYREAIESAPQEGAAPEEVEAATPEPADEADEAAAAPVAEEASVTPLFERKGEPLSTPVARRLAEEHGISLTEVRGTGPGGRILKRDVLRHIEEGRPKTQVTVPAKRLPLDQKRKYIVRKMVESKTTIPHYYLAVDVVMDQALMLRKQYNETTGASISITDLFVKASALALETYPLVNAYFNGDEIVYNEHINIAVAVDTGDVLLAPVIKNCEEMTLTELSDTAKRLIEKARNKKLHPEDYEGGTFYISNIGNFGIDEIAPIVFPRTSAILGVGAINKTPVVEENEVVIRNVVKITISADHRVLDGARAAEFLAELKANLERPLKLFS